MVLRFPTVDSVDGILSPKILIQSEDSELIDFLMENLKTFCGTCPDQSCSVSRLLSSVNWSVLQFFFFYNGTFVKYIIALLQI